MKWWDGHNNSSRPIGYHELFIAIVQLTVLLFVARVLGELFNSIRPPSVIGELLAGVILGPSILGLVAPGIYEPLFAISESEFHLLEIISWIGLIMLLIVIGLETDIDLIISKGRTAVILSLGGILVPFVTGFVLGWFLPGNFVGAPDQRLVFSLFIATAMSISAIPVIAKVLTTVAVRSRPEMAITDIAETNDVDLVVVGTETARLVSEHSTVHVLNIFFRTYTVPS